MLTSASSYIRDNLHAHRKIAPDYARLHGEIRLAVYVTLKSTGMPRTSSWMLAALPAFWDGEL
jgi:hypothetical protein